MPPRLPYPKLAPQAFEALSALGHHLKVDTALPPTLLALVYLRASLLNGCSFCIGIHKKELLQANEPQTRIDAVLDWSASDAFTPRERAAFAWTDAITNVQDGHASDAAYAAVSGFFHDKDLVDLTFAIAQINAWNRLGIAFAVEWAPPARKAATTE
jgi:AhpD family alkylhydroperoxidase